MFEYTKNYHTLKSLVHPTCLSLQLDTVLNGSNPGFVYVNDMEQPKTAMVYHQGEGGFFFIGEPDLDFISSILDGLAEIESKHFDKQLKDFEFSGDSTNWLPIFHQLNNLNHCQQFIYHSKEDDSLEVTCIDGVEIIPIDEDTFTLRNSDFTTKPITEWWSSLDEYLKHSMGFVAVKDQKIIGHCLLDGISNSMMGIGIAVENDYRKKGIATALAFSMVNAIKDRGYESYWECTDNNYASQALAAKCKLEKVQAYDLFWIDLSIS